MRNVLLASLNDAAELVIGSAKPSNKPLCQLEGIDSTFDLAFMIGYHSKAGTPGGLLAHTYIGSVVREWRLNGTAVGEVTMNAAIFGSFGVPVGLVVGNSEVADEVRALDERLRFVSTKRTLGPTAAICATPNTTRRLIADASAEVVQDHDRHCMIHSTGRVVIEVDMYRREQAEKASGEPFVDRVGDSAVRCEAPDAAEAFRVMWRACTRALDEAPAWLA
jgi:D-amino peptidase